MSWLTFLGGAAAMAARIYFPPSQEPLDYTIFQIGISFFLVVLGAGGIVATRSRI